MRETTSHESHRRCLANFYCIHTALETRDDIITALLTRTGDSLDGGGDAVGAVLRDGFDGQLVLTHGGLHYGNGLQGGGRLGALDDATGAAYGGDGGDRLHFDWEEDTNDNSALLR